MKPVPNRPVYDLAVTASYFDKVAWWLNLANFLDAGAYRYFAHVASLQQATDIFELGPGLGTFAMRILRQSDVPRRWVLAEASKRLCSILMNNLTIHDSRAELFYVDKHPPFPYPDHSFDRVVACFVLDCMDRQTQIRYIAEAHRLLRTGGSLCIMSVTHGTTRLSRLIMGLGNILSSVSPALTLGASFLEVSPSIDTKRWRIVMNNVIVSMGFTTRIIIARPRVTEKDC